MTSVTPLLIVRVDLADWADQVGIPFLPHCSMCIPPETLCTVKEGDPSQYRMTVPRSRVYEQLFSHATTSRQDLKIHF